MKFCCSNKLSRAVLLLGVALLTACEGESRPFEEAAEVQTLGLVGLSVTLPVIERFDQFTINNGQRVALGIAGLTDDPETTVNVSAANRQWQSDKPSVVSVSDNGVVTGGEDGQAQVSVIIGGIVSSTQLVNVENRTLLSIAGIESVEVDEAGMSTDTLERCLPGEFFAVGQFEGQSMRPLYDASFSLVESPLASRQMTDNQTVLVNVSTLDAVTLSATQGELTPLTLQFTVLDTLRTIAVTPRVATVDEGETQNYRATGTYSEEPATGMPTDAGDATADTRTEDITDNVQWAVIDGVNNASIVNTGDNKGRLTGRAEGNATVQASCGDDKQAEVQVAINDVTSSESSELSFDISRSDNVLEVAFGSSFPLRASRGTEFDGDNVANFSDLRFRVETIGGGGDVLNITALEELGNIEPQFNGASARIIVTLVDDDGDELASGTLTVRVIGS